ncbi:Probable endo-1,3(4)-beta-glucanase ARB_01444 [Linum perenne]
MIKKLTRRVKTVIIKPFNKRRVIRNNPSSSSSPPFIPPPPPPEQLTPIAAAPADVMPKPSFPFHFPQQNSTVLPDPSKFFSSSLLSSPLPTNSFFQNFTLKNGDQPEYIHPYIVKSANSSLSISYPSLFHNSSFTYHVFTPDLTLSGDDGRNPNGGDHVITSFNDLSLTLDFPSSNLRFYLVRGSPFITCLVPRNTSISISTIHAILSCCSSTNSLNKYKLNLNNNQTWVIYSSSPINLTHTPSSVSIAAYSGGILRIAVLPNESDPDSESILDRFSSCYPVSGQAAFTKPFSVEYRWEKKGYGDLLMLAHPLHLKLLSSSDDEDCDVAVLDGLKYRSMDGDLVAVVGDSWVLKSDPISVTWHSIKGIRDDCYNEIVDALCKDVDGLNASAIATTSSYFYGKLIARGARLALIAEEVGFPDVIPAVRKFLKEAIEPWLNGTFNGNGFLYDSKWGGIITKQGLTDSGADFGFGIYNDHHFHLGYFLYGIAVLAKIDPSWGRKYKPQAYSLMADFMSLGKRSNSSVNSSYTRLRCFDLYKLHSWAGGLTEFADGRNQESTSEAVNAYYAAALMGLAYGDTHLVSIGSILSALEIQAAQTWWHVKEGDSIYAPDFTSENRVVGVLWSTKRDSGLWFAPPEWKECRLGIQVLPLLPITEVVFSDSGFVRQLVEWTLPALNREGVGEGWKGFVYALEAVYDKGSALEKTKRLNGHDDGNSVSNMLWWIHSRDDEEQGIAGCEDGGKFCWFGHYCH